ncbi:MAG: mechanosensitive ion channel [Xanthomonadales bacterium]|nr:mechanosensitive ion channel [Xanthomonadales bacterium]
MAADRLIRLLAALALALWLAGAAAVAAQAPPADADGPDAAQVDDDPASDPAVAAEIERLAQGDADLARRVQAVMVRVPALAGIRVEVTSGLATLRGSVDTEAMIDVAGQLANAVDGVVAVDNRVYLETALERRLAPVLADGMERLRRLIVALPLLGLALAIVVGLHLLGGLLVRVLAPLRRFSRNPFLTDLMHQALRLAVTVMGVLVALDLLGATALVGAVLGAAGIVGLAVGFAFKDLVENYIAGILLSLRQPFAPNDHVVIDGHEGRVATLTARATTLITLDGNHLRLPNALVFKAVILNYTRNPTRRFVFEFGIGNGEDLCRARELCLAALAGTPGVIAQPPPAMLVRALADSSVTLRCSAWVDQRRASFGKVQSEAIQAVKAALEGAGMDLPEPIYRVQLSQSGAASMPGSTPTVVTPVAPGSSPAASAGRSPRAPAEPAAAADIAPEVHIDAQVEDEARQHGEDNLLRADGPRE